MREAYKWVPVPRWEPELPQRAHEAVWAGDPHPAQEGQAVRVPQGVQAGEAGGVREQGEEAASSSLWQGSEDCVQLQAGGAVPRGDQAVLLQGREVCLGEGLRR